MQTNAKKHASLNPVHPPPPCPPSHSQPWHWKLRVGKNKIKRGGLRSRYGYACQGKTALLGHFQLSNVAFFAGPGACIPLERPETGCSRDLHLSRCLDPVRFPERWARWTRHLSLDRVGVAWPRPPLSLGIGKSEAATLSPKEKKNPQL